MEVTLREIDNNYTGFRVLLMLERKCGFYIVCSEIARSGMLR